MPTARDNAAPGPITVALVNNMPDGAFRDTEAQFRRVLASGDSEPGVAVELYTFPGLSRSDEIASEIRERYQSLDTLRSRRPDALIITGTEPIEPELEQEPYWPDLTGLMQWASETVPTTLLSCLTAHASLQFFDGIRRQRLPLKCTGVLQGKANPQAGKLIADLPDPVSVPHSRLNGVPAELLRAAGYTIVVDSSSSSDDWSVATKQQGISTFVLCQGHFEYNTDSILREYRRDVRRFLFGNQQLRYPPLPFGYFSEKQTEMLLRLAHTYKTERDTDPLELYRRFPFQRLRADLHNSWEQSGAILFRNWLRLAQARRGEQPDSSRRQYA
jgi:homoserine O-succinyltransferase